MNHKVRLRLFPASPSNLLDGMEQTMNDPSISTARPYIGSCGLRYRAPNETSNPLAGTTTDELLYTSFVRFSVHDRGSGGIPARSFPDPFLRSVHNGTEKRGIGRPAGQRSRAPFDSDEISLR